MTKPLLTASDVYPPLTAREREVAQLAVQHKSNKEIATQLVISPLTVKTHIHHILDKLGLKSRAELRWVFADHDQSNEEF